MTNSDYEITDIRNIDFRAAFTAVSLAALPYFRSGAFHSDLLWDARTLVQMADGDVLFLVVRGYGTNAFIPSSNTPLAVTDMMREAIDHCDPRLSEAIDPCYPRLNDGRAVLRVVRVSDWDWKISIVFERREQMEMDLTE